MFLLSLFLSSFLEQEPPLLKIKPVQTEQIFKKRIPITINLEKIYTQDLFDTFSPEAIKTPSQQNFVTSIPEPKIPAPTPIPEIKKQEFIPALTISLKGIIFTPDENKNVAMFTDETNKEAIYHVGDRIKDGQIIKIAKNKVVILRANGQEEVFLLKKEENILNPEEKIKWKYSVKKINDTTFEIDPENFAKDVGSLGYLIEELDLITAYDKGQTIGLRVGKTDASELRSQLGLNSNDIITSINNISTKEPKDRIAIFDKITQMKIGEKIKVIIKRNNQDSEINYSLVKIEREKPKAQILFKSGTGEILQPPADKFKMSKDQEREIREKEFEKFHRNPKQQQMANDMRNRFLENLRARTRNRMMR